MTYIKAGIAVVCALVSEKLGGWDLSLQVLVAFFVMDYLTAVIGAYKEKKLNSEVGLWGITRKILLLIPIAMAYCIDLLLSQDIFRNLAVWFYIANEGLSVLENLGRLNVLVPPWLTDALQQLKNKGEGKSDV